MEFFPQPPESWDPILTLNGRTFDKANRETSRELGAGLIGASYGWISDNTPDIVWEVGERIRVSVELPQEAVPTPALPIFGAFALGAGLLAAGRRRLLRAAPVQRQLTR